MIFIGVWRKAYTNVLTRLADPNLRYTIFQTINCEIPDLSISEEKEKEKEKEQETFIKKTEGETSDSSTNESESDSNPMPAVALDASQSYPDKGSNEVDYQRGNIVEVIRWNFTEYSKTEIETDSSTGDKTTTATDDKDKDKDKNNNKNNNYDNNNNNDNNVPGVTVTETESESYGDFQVKSTYEFNTKGDMFLKVQEMLLLPVTLPKNIDGMITSLQSTVPYDSFDPNEAYYSNTFIGTDVRITRVSGEKLREIVNIYVRETPMHFE